MTLCPHCGKDTGRQPARFTATPERIHDIYDIWGTKRNKRVTQKVLVVILKDDIQVEAEQLITENIHGH